MDELSGKLQSISEEIMHMDMVRTNGDSEGEFSPASSIFESKMKKTSIELKYMASRTKRLSRVISSNENVLQIRRSVNRRNSPNDFQLEKENNINKTGIVFGKSWSSSSKIETSIEMNNNPDNQFKRERILTNPTYSSVYYLTNEENFIPRKLSNKSHNSSAEVIVPNTTDNNSNGQPNEEKSEVLHNKRSQLSTSGGPHSKEESIIAKKLFSRSQSLSKEVNTPIPTNNISNIQSEGQKAGTSNRRSSKELSSVDEFNKRNIMKRKLSRESKSSSKEFNVKTQKDDISEGGSEKEKSGRWNNENRKNSPSHDYESKEQIIKERGLSGNVLSPSEEMNALLLKHDVVDEQEEDPHMWNIKNRRNSSFADHEANDKIIKVRKLSTKSALSGVNSSDSLFEDENVKLSYRNKLKARRLSSKSQASTVQVKTPKIMNNNLDEKSKGENLEITTERNIKHSASIDYQSNGENKARKSSNESKSMSAEIDAQKLTDKSSDKKKNEDQAELSNKIKTSSVHDELHEDEGTTRKVSSALRTMSENINTALSKDNSRNSQLATEKIENLHEKSKNSSLADELASSEALRHNENTSDKLKLTSNDANAPVSPSITSNDHLRKSETETPIIQNGEKTIVSETSYTHERNDVQENIAKNIQESSSEGFRSASQSKLDATKLQSSSSVGHQPHSVDRDDIEEQQSNTNEEMNSPTPSNILAHEQLKEDETKKPNVENRDNPPCINCKPFSTDIKIIVKQIPAKQESISSEFSESLPEVIHGQMQNVKSKRSENLNCVDCPPCSSLLKASSYQSPSESNDLISESEVPAFVKTSIKQELSMPKTHEKISQSISKETNGDTSANVSININDEKSSIVDSASYTNEVKTKGKHSVDHTSMSVNFSLGEQSKEDKTEGEERSQNARPADYLPISEQPNTMTEKVSETNTETTASLPSDVSTIGQFEDEKPNKVACIDCPACSHIIENVPKQFSEKRSHVSSNTSGLLPFSCSGHSGGYNMEKSTIESSENSFCVDCPPCSNKLENVSEYSAGLSGEIFSESELSDIVANIQARHNIKHSLRTETSRSVSSEGYSQNGSIGLPNQETHASRSISEVTNKDSFNQSNRVEQEISNSFCTNCPPCSNKIENPIIISNVSSNARSKSSEAESYLKKTVFSKSPSISDATSSTTYPGLSTNIQLERTKEEKEATSKRNEVSPIGDYLAQSDAINSIEERKIAESKTSDELKTTSKETKRKESKGIEINIMKTYNKNNPKSNIHSSRSNEVNKLVISILDSCTSKIFSPEGTSVAVVLDTKKLVKMAIRVLKRGKISTDKT
ncbi:hypothetical protein WA026_010995 [Henosepilachna vigintioctopunctata]|uniref:Uncharacterized protein n=1 Tax=Henosepilachna vigintioctopunctata TaxID=420089 RepID=A0AAW1UYD8_9CUCU